MTRTTPIEFDLDAIEAALRQLSALAWERRMAKGGTVETPPPNMPDTEIGGLIADPIAGAVALAHRALHAYLISTLGSATANEITARIHVETIPAKALALSSGTPARH